MKTALQPRPGWTCHRCGTTTTRGNWRREAEELVFYCQPCVMILGGPAYDSSIPTPFAAGRTFVKKRRQAHRRTRFPHWIRKHI